MNSKQEQSNTENDSDTSEIFKGNTSSENVNRIKEEPKEDDENYRFGWSNYSEITNGRFAMLGIIAIILIELISQKSFLEWAGIL